MSAPFLTAENVSLPTTDYKVGSHEFHLAVNGYELFYCRLVPLRVFEGRGKKRRFVEYRTGEIEIYVSDKAIIKATSLDEAKAKLAAFLNAEFLKETPKGN
jgi:hypothetical protein